MQEESHTDWDEWLSSFPLKPGDTLWLTADLSRIAAYFAINKKRFSPQLLVDDLIKRINPGTLLIPAFVQSYKRNQIFNLIDTLPTTGSLSKWAMKSSYFERSNDPFHSFLIKGIHANLFLSAQSDSTFGSNSIFELLYRNNAVMLLWDVDFQHSFTFAHFVEEMLQVPYRTYRNYHIPIMKDGIISQHTVRYFEKKPGYQLSLYPIKDLLIANNACMIHHHKGISCAWVDLHAAFHVIEEDILRHQGKNLVTFDRRQWCKDWIKRYIK